VKGDELFPELIEDVERILDCRVDGCERACPACVLASDLVEEDVRRLDRKSALALVRERLLADAAPEDADRASPGARFSLDVLGDLRQAMERGGRQATFRLSGALDPAALVAWPAAAVARHWVGRGRRVVVAVDEGAVDALNGAERLQLRDLVNQLGVAVEEGCAPPYSNGAELIAEVIASDGSALAFAARDKVAAASGDGWGRPERAPIVRFDAPAAAWVGRAVDLSRLAPPPGASFRHVGHELDGPLDGFGGRAAKMLREVLAAAGIAAEDAVAEVTYEDRYLLSPVTLRLCLDTLGKLASDSVTTAAPIPLTVRTFEVRESPMPLPWLDQN
jgi:hypothetical protein